MGPAVASPKETTVALHSSRHELAHGMVGVVFVCWCYALALVSRQLHALHDSYWVVVVYEYMP